MGRRGRTLERRPRASKHGSEARATAACGERRQISGAPLTLPLRRLPLRGHGNPRDSLGAQEKLAENAKDNAPGIEWFYRAIYMKI